MRDSLTYLSLWNERLNAASDAPFLITETEAFSYADVWHNIERTASHLKKEGIGKGDFAAIRCIDNLRTAELILSLPLIGAAAAPLSRFYSLAEIEKILSDGSFSCFIGDEVHLLSLERVKKINIRNIINSREKKESFSPTVQESSKPVTVIFTSGSMDKPKAVTHNFANHYYSALGSNDNIKFGDGDVWLLSLPFYHIAGLSLLFRALVSGAAVRIAERSESLHSILHKEHITHLSLVETQLINLLNIKELNVPLKKLKAVLLGGSAISLSLIEDAYRRSWKIHTSYGSTEMSSQIAATPTDADPEVLKSSGKLLKYRELKISETGEVLLKGETLSPGYLRGGKIIDIRDGQGWYASGDVGTVDGSGLLHITGRIDNMFISGGENIYPEVIERTVKTLSGVINALVVPVPDKRFGRRPALFVKMKNGETPGLKLIRKKLSDKLAAYMLPDYVFPWPDKTVQKGIKISRNYFITLAEKRIR